MNKGGRPKAPLILSDDERQKLETWAARPKSTQRLATRARIILACAEGLDNTDVAARLRVNTVTVGKWRKRFLDDRLEGLADEPRPGALRTITDAMVERVITKTLEEKPKAATHWSTRGMAKAVGLSQTAIGRVWHAFGLKPHLSETFKLSTDPYFVEKVRDVVGLYMSPPENAIVLSVDEKSQVQALDRTQPLLPMTPGQAERRTPDYVRNGTTSLFAALNVATGQVIGKCYRRHRQQEFLKFLNEIDAQVAAGAGGRDPHDPGQLRDAQGAEREAVVRAASRVSPPFHADQRFVAEPGGAVLRRDHREGDPSRGVPERGGVGEGDHGIPGRSQRESQAVRVDRRRGTDPGSSQEGL